MSHAHGLWQAISCQWALDGPVYGVVGVGWAANDLQALELARADRVHAEALLLLQRSGEWGGQPHDRPPGMDAQVHQVAWSPSHARALAMLGSRWKPRVRLSAGAAGSLGAPEAVHRPGLAWLDLTPPAWRSAGQWVVRALWLDGEGGDFSLSELPSQLH